MQLSMRSIPLPMHCYVEQTNTPPPKQINSTDGTKDIMSTDWVQPHMQKDQFPNSEINNYYLGLYMKFLFNRAKNGFFVIGKKKYLLLEFLW